MRIVSFLPSATEILYALGVGENVVGVSHECDYPPDASTKLRINESLLDNSKLQSEMINKTAIELCRVGSSCAESTLINWKKLTQFLSSLKNHVRRAP